MIQLILFSISIVVFSVNMYFVGLLWFSDKQNRKNSQIASLMAMGAATCFWIIFDTVGGVAQAYTYGYMYTFRSIMLIIAPFCFLWYMLQFVNTKAAKSRPIHVAMILLQAIDIALLITNPIHRLVFVKDGFPLPEYGPLFIFHSALAYGAIGLGVVLLFRYIIKEKPPKLFSFAWIVACALPIVGNVLFTVGIIEMRQDVAPFGFALIFMLFALYSYRSRLSSLKSNALSDVFESYSDAVVLLNTNGIVEDVNASFREFFPDFQLEAERTGFDSLLYYLSLAAHGDESRKLLDLLRQSPKDFDTGEFSSLAVNGEEKTFRLRRQEVLGGGGRRVTGRLYIFSDISSYRSMIREINEQNKNLMALRVRAEAASEAKSTFLANMSHEMRTPLNAIIGLSELVLRKEIDDDTRDSIENVYESWKNLLGVISDILDISKIESGKFDLIPVEYYTADLINDAVNQNKVRIGNKPITFRLKVDKNLPSKLIGDELRVRQILNNFLSNAIKYTNEGEVELNIAFERSERYINDDEKDPVVAAALAIDVAWLRLSVRDTGIGIKEEDLPRLFSEYNQVDLTVNRNVEGTGLGLAISRQLSTIMGGNVEVTSEYGVGSVFTSMIRQQIADPEPMGEKTAEALEQFRHTAERRAEDADFLYTPMPHGRVLVVDDLEINREVAKGMLEPYELNVDLVEGGEEAVELVRRGEPHYDLIFMDQMMPGMDGIEAVRIIREEIGTEYAKNIPVVALTANAMLGSEEMFLKEGFQGYLAKPIDLRDLNSVIVRFLPSEA